LGNISFSISRELVLAIQKEFKYKNFVETGTYLGGTAIWASEHFENIYTIEIDHEISQKAFYNARNKSNIEFIVGDSSNELKIVTESLEGLNMYWLDGHWCQEVPRVSSECPLMDELNSIVTRESDIILIDDARFFMGIVPYPHNPDNWPRVDDIILILKKRYPTHQIVIDFDIIMCLPHEVYSIYQEKVRSGLIWQNESVPISRNKKKSVVVQVANYFKTKIRNLSKGKNSLSAPLFDEYTNSKQRLTEYIRNISINMLIDIGASHGNFIESVRAIHPDCNVIAFEPIEKVFTVLKTKFKDDISVKLYNMAIGNKVGEIDFFVNDYSFSSSVLSLKDRHIKEFPYTNSISKKTVHIERLDSIVDQAQVNKSLFVKIDVQGLEMDVIEGGNKILSIADYVLIEVSYVELYHGQGLFWELNERLNQLGLFYNGSFGQLYSNMNGQVLQADAIYIRRKQK
jgi:FkbM family methyltransferase